MNRLRIEMTGQQPPGPDLACGDADPAWQALQAELEKRIKAGLPGQVSAHSIAAILEEELAAPAY